MARKTIKTEMKYGVSGLDYVILKNVPIKKSKFGDVIDLDMAHLEKRIAQELIKQRVPIRGAEVHFLRKVLGLSMAHFGAALGISGTSVMKWENKKEKRLDPINEVAVRAFIAEKLKVDLKGAFSELVGAEDTPDAVYLKAS